MIYHFLAFADEVEADIDVVTFSMEDRLRSLGILNDRNHVTPSSISDSSILEGISLTASTPKKKASFSRWKNLNYTSLLISLLTK